MPIPEFVIALGETYTAAGRLAEAAQQYALVDVMIQLAGENGVQTDAEFALFLADHGGDPARAVALAETAYTARPSVFAADVLAWSRFRAGDIEGAWTASQEALHLGTRDARMLFHAGMIADARGDRAAAISLLKTALAINPSFSLIATDTARETLNHLTTTTS
jgi:tetratricopeptide (TPR) repeat protein